METLRNYLNTMFQSLPDTAEVKRAKDELWQMMEDKYSDLISDGMSENEAVGTVIAEFGNLDDFADILKIRSLVPVPYVRPKEENIAENQYNNGQYSSNIRNGNNPGTGSESSKYGYTAKPCRILSVIEVGDYLKEITKINMIRAIGVFLCITCVIGFIFFGGIGDYMWIFERLFDVISMLVFWGFIILGVLFFIWSGRLNERWKFIRKERCILDPEARFLVENRYRGVQSSARNCRTIGILFCAFCWLPVAILSALDISFITEILGPTMLFLLVGAGVGLIVISSGVEDAHKKLLKRDQKFRAEGQILQ